MKIEWILCPFCGSKTRLKIRNGAMEGTRTPGLLIRRNRMAHFVHFII